jgi:integral membrane protein
LKIVTWLRYVALFEGVSWLLLLFVAMPLKYMAGNPYPVKVVGMGHGVLFIALVVLLLLAAQRRMISNALSAKVFVASFIPFGTFVTDGRLKHNAEQ